MSPSFTTVLGRIGFQFLAIPALALLIAVMGWAPSLSDLINSNRFLLPFIAIFVFGSKWIDALLCPRPYGPQEYASLGLLDLFIASCLAATWASRAATMMAFDFYSADLGLRLTFGLFTIRGTAYLLLAAGSIEKTRVERRNRNRLIGIVVIAVLATAVVSFGSRAWSWLSLRSQIHERAIPGPDAKAVP